MFDETDLLAWIDEPNDKDRIKAIVAVQVLIAEAKEAQDERDDLQEQLDATPDESELYDALSTLETVRFWFHDFLFLGKPVTPPRRILAQVERAMGHA